MFCKDDVIGSFVLVRPLGRGSFGEVWLAERRTKVATISVALKFPLHEVRLDEVKQEAALWAQASGHPNVLPIIEADIYDGQIAIVSEYASDGSLEKWLEAHSGKAPSTSAAVKMVIGILSGLEHLHSRKIIHRDLKPDNVLLQGENPRIGDFGLSHLLQSMSHSNQPRGAYAYMAPEAVNGERSERTDVWSVGVILYRLLSGSLPFPQHNILTLCDAIQYREPRPLPSSVPDNIRQIVTTALQKTPSARYASANKMLNALCGDVNEEMSFAMDKYFSTSHRDFLRKKFKELFVLLFPQKVSIEAVEHGQYYERYRFSRSGETACIDFCYNKKEQFTQVTPKDNLGNSLNLLAEVEAMIQGKSDGK